MRWHRVEWELEGKGEEYCDVLCCSLLRCSADPDSWLVTEMARIAAVHNANHITLLFAMSLGLDS